MKSHETGINVNVDTGADMTDTRRNSAARTAGECGKRESANGRNAPEPETHIYKNAPTMRRRSVYI